MMVEVVTENKKGIKETQEINISEFVDVKGWKSIGNRLSLDTVKKVTLLTEKLGEPAFVEDEDLSNSDEEEIIDAQAEDIKPTAEPIIRPDSPQLDLL